MTGLGVRTRLGASLILSSSTVLMAAPVAGEAAMRVVPLMEASVERRADSTAVLNNTALYIKIGIGAGVPVLFGLVLLLSTCVYRRYRKRHQDLFPTRLSKSEMAERSGKSGESGLMYTRTGQNDHSYIGVSDTSMEEESGAAFGSTAPDTSRTEYDPGRKSPLTSAREGPETIRPSLQSAYNPTSTFDSSHHDSDFGNRTIITANQSKAYREPVERPASADRVTISSISVGHSAYVPASTAETSTSSKIKPGRRHRNAKRTSWNISRSSVGSRLSKRSSAGDSDAVAGAPPVDHPLLSSEDGRVKRKPVAAKVGGADAGAGADVVPSAPGTETGPDRDSWHGYQSKHDLSQISLPPPFRGPNNSISGSLARPPPRRGSYSPIATASTPRAGRECVLGSGSGSGGIKTLGNPYFRAEEYQQIDLRS